MRQDVELHEDEYTVEARITPAEPMKPAVVWRCVQASREHERGLKPRPRLTDCAEDGLSFGLVLHRSLAADAAELADDFGEDSLESACRKLVERELRESGFPLPFSVTGVTLKPKSASPLVEIPVTLPPVLTTLMRYPGTARFLLLYYVAGKATYADGRMISTCSFYACFEVLKEHPVVALHLHRARANLGYDDLPATHALVCDRKERKLFVAGLDAACELVAGQRQEETAEPDPEAVAFFEQTAGAPRTLGDLHLLGAFEFIGGPDPALAEQTRQLSEWLDRFITEEVVLEIAEATKGHNFSFHRQLQYLRQWLQRQQSALTAGPAHAAEDKTAGPAS